jgi:hypothetical protein
MANTPNRRAPQVASPAEAKIREQTALLNRYRRAHRTRQQQVLDDPKVGPEYRRILDWLRTYVKEAVA